MSKFLSITGLEHLWAKIKAHVLQNGTFYGTCGTAAATVAKEATVAGVTELKTGVTVAVKFTYSNTAANPTLNVNSLGAKAIKRYGTTAPSTSAASSWNANSVITLSYDGTYWQMHDWNNTTYSSMTVAEYEAGTGTTARTITPARLKAAIQTWAVPPTRTINGHALSSDITLVEGLTPLIGASSSITPAQVATALGEGRDICISHTGVLNNVNLELKFTSWNRATDTDYGGNAIDVVVSHSIAYYNSIYYLFELVGTGGAWDLNNTSLAKTTDIPTVSVDRKTTAGTNIADITINGTTTQLYAPTSGGGGGTITKVKTTAGAHQTIDVSSGAVEFSVPTNTSDLTNDSNYVSGTGLFKIVDVSVSVPSISAHSQNNLGTQTVPSADRPSGMTLVGIVGYGCGNLRIVPYNYYVNGEHSFTLAMVNTTASASSATTFTAKLLYIKATSA